MVSLAFKILVVPQEKEGSEFCCQSILYQITELVNTLMMLLSKG